MNGETHRQCSKCKQTKLIDEYYWANKSKGKRHSCCSVCSNIASKAQHRKTYPHEHEKVRARNKRWAEANKEWHKVYRRRRYLDNHELELQQRREYKRTHPEETAETNREWRKRNRERLNGQARERRRRDPAKARAKDKIYRERNPEKGLKYRRTYEQKHRDRINAMRRKRNRERVQNDPNYRIARSLRNRLRDALKGKGIRKAARTLDLLGCDAPTLRSRLESLWLPGMSWDNYGFYGWHIDHIKPVASFDLTDPEQQRICFHWSNLQPLWGKDNQRKSKCIDHPCYPPSP